MLFWEKKTVETSIVTDDMLQPKEHLLSGLLLLLILRIAGWIGDRWVYWNLKISTKIIFK